LQAVAVGPEMVGVMDGPGAQPQHFSLELAEQPQPLHRSERGHGHGIRLKSGKILAFRPRIDVYREEFHENWTIQAMIDLDAIDRRILEQLQHDGRLSNADLAEKVGLSSSPCWRRVKALEDAGVIKRYAALLDAKTVGLSVNVFMSVSLSTQVEKALKDFERAAAARPEVMDCYLMTGDRHYLLRIALPDLEAYERFVMDFTKI